MSNHTYLPKRDICWRCAKKVGKWAAILYAAHWALHALVFLISPVVGTLFLALF